MDFNELKQLYLKDMISRNKTGISPLHNNGKLARRYSNMVYFKNLSFFSVIVMSFYSVTKNYTGRTVYLAGLGASCAVYLFSRYASSKMKNTLFEKLNCTDNEDFENKLYVHKYTFVDQKDYYQNRV